MNRLAVAGWVLAAALAGALIAGTYSNRVGAQGAGGYGWWGPGMMGPGMMGPGMMGPGMMGYGWGPRGQPGDLNLSVNDVKGYLERWIAMAGNPRIKVGNVTESHASTITADIVTTDKEALVQRFSVDRSTGFFSSVE